MQYPYFQHHGSLLLFSNLVYMVTNPSLAFNLALQVLSQSATSFQGVDLSRRSQVQHSITLPCQGFVVWNKLSSVLEYLNLYAEQPPLHDNIIKYICWHCVSINCRNLHQTFKINLLLSVTLYLKYPMPPSAYMYKTGNVHLTFI